MMFGKIQNKATAWNNCTHHSILYAVYLIEDRSIIIQNEEFDENQSFNCALVYCSVGQSFTPQNDIEVKRVGVEFIDASGSIVITIRSYLDSDVLATTEEASIVRNGWTELPLQKSIVLQKGTQYFLRWDTVVGEDARFLYKAGNPYLYGNAWAKTTYGWTLQTTQIQDIDMVFKIIGTEKS